MRYRLRINKINVLIFLSLAAVIVSVPYIFWYLFGSYYILISSGLILLLFALTTHFYFQRGLRLDRNDKLWISVWFTFICAFTCYSIIMLILYDDLYEFKKLMGLIVKFLFLLTLVVIVRENFLNYLNKVFKINVIILVLSIVLFFILAFGIGFPHFVFSKIDTRPHFVYWIGATNIVFNFGGFNLIRIAGFADEPGWFALIITYLIVLNELSYRSAKLRIGLVIGGLFTFSMAFVLTLGVFLFYWIIKGILNAKATLIISLVIVLIAGLSQLKEIKPIVKMVSVFSERFEKGRGGKFKGDNRSESFPVQISAFMDHPILGVGIDPEVMKRIETGNPSFFSYLAMHGIWGTIFYYLPVYLLIALNLKRKELILLLAIFINYFQRPGIEDMFSIMALTLIFYASLNQNKDICNTQIGKVELES